VEVDGRRAASIGPGLLILLGCAKGDTDADAGYLAAKCAVLRIFEDDAGKMNLSALDKGFEALVVSQFTLLGDARKGRRPSFDCAAVPAAAEKLVDGFVSALQRLGVNASKGVFGAFMQVSLVNDGPVTILLDSKKAF
jgi:D-tyrosyl-tRNA(Tyr) deacylase